MRDRTSFLQELSYLEKREQKLLDTAPASGRLKQALYEKVPPGLSATLETAFEKAFRLVFLKGTRVIERTFDKESAGLEFEAGDYVVSRAQSRKSIRRMDRGVRRSSFVNSAATTATGLGLGLLGLGLPDIPLLVTTLLRGVYEIALGYGFGYESEAEQIYILRLIRTALSSGPEKSEMNRLLDIPHLTSGILDAEIAGAARSLSDALLVEKFVQGIPIVGVVGGFVNHAVYSRVSTLAQLKYKKRYLRRKLAEMPPVARD